MRARHELLQGAIGTFPEEDYAYWLVTTLMWALPLTTLLASVVDVGLIFIYMKKAHPWKGLLTDEEAEEAKKEKQKQEKKEKKLKKKQAKPKNTMKRHFPPDFL